MISNTKERIVITLDKKLIEELDWQCIKHGNLTRSAMISYILSSSFRLEREIEEEER